MKNFQHKAIFFLIVALAATALNICVLSNRNDGEKIAVAKDANHAVFSFSEPSEVSLFVCLPDAEADRLTQNQAIYAVEYPTRPLETLLMSEPRPLEIPAPFATKHDVATHVMCAVSPIFQVTPGGSAQTMTFASTNSEPKMMPGMVDLSISEAMSIPVPKDALVVAAVSSGNQPWREILLFFAFLGSLLTAGIFGARAWIALNSKKRPAFLSYLRFYDAPIAFVSALFLAGLIALFISDSVPASSVSLLPGFWEMLVMLSANFLAFLTIAAFYCGRGFIKCKRQAESEADAPGCESETARAPEDISSESSSEAAATNWKTRVTHFFMRSEDPTPFPAWLPVALGVGLAVTAVISVMFAPMPGLSTAEMASQLTSTCFLTAHFAVLAGISEECLFRGVIQSSLEARPNSKHPALINAIAILITTAFFVSIHVPQSMDHLWALIPIGCVSMVAGWLKLHYRSIFPAVLLHMTYNSVLLLPSLLV